MVWEPGTAFLFISCPQVSFLLSYISVFISAYEDGLISLVFSAGPTVGGKCPCDAALDFIIFTCLGTSIIGSLSFSLSRFQIPGEGNGVRETGLQHRHMAFRSHLLKHMKQRDLPRKG